MASLYPPVRSEAETISRVLAGASIARYGDGEFKLCRGASACAQVYEDGLSERLRAILSDSGHCMVGIPAIHSKTPKKEFWAKYADAAKWMDASRTYGSSFITRPDSAPWIDTNEYWASIESLWLGEDVTLVRGSAKGLTAEDMMGAGVIREIICPRQHSYAEYDNILQRIGHPKRAILCLGPTATVLAVDLCARGVHAIDLGHAALFLRKHRRGEPMGLSKEDKSHEKAIA